MNTRTLTAVPLLILLVACAPPGRPAGSGDDDDAPGPSADAAVADAALGGPDAASLPDAAGGPDAASGAPDASAGGPDAAAGTGLPPDLETPDPGGQKCDVFGAMSGGGQCPSLQVCRPFTSTEGRCESCGSCGNLNASCGATNECDILFTCYQGRCVGFCTLGTSECGAPADCVDIGHPTRGICKPL